MFKVEKIKGEGFPGRLGKTIEEYEGVLEFVNDMEARRNAPRNQMLFWESLTRFQLDEIDKLLKSVLYEVHRINPKRRYKVGWLQGQENPAFVAVRPDSRHPYTTAWGHIFQQGAESRGILNYAGVWGSLSRCAPVKPVRVHWVEITLIHAVPGIVRMKD